MTAAAGAPLWRVVRHVAADHPAFDGHFPGRPILPGVVLLCEVAEVMREVPQLAAALGALPQLGAVKFLAPVGPASDLVIEIRDDGRQVMFEVAVAGSLVAKGHFRRNPAAEPMA